MATGSIKESQGQRKSEIEVDLENENRITIINMYRNKLLKYQELTAIFLSHPQVILKLSYPI